MDPVMLTLSIVSTLGILGLLGLAIATFII
jgi:hypothetical protein